MIQVRPSAERGQARLDWLDSRFTFSFDRYYDPRHMGFHALRVINEDRVAPGGGFPMHPHRDMEIVTYMLEGALEHKDSMGNGSVIRPGEVQRMSAGTGILHSEFNPSETHPAHLLQIWIHPREKGIEPGYEQRAFDPSRNIGRLQLIASPDGENGAVTIRQDLDLYSARLEAGKQVTHALAAGRHAWVQVARGGIELNGVALAAGDGAAISEETHLKMAASQPSEFLLFDMK